MKRGAGPVQVFYAYAQADEPLRQELEKHLSQLQRQGLIEGWHAQLAVVGEPWAEQVEQALNTASLILLLISADFLASEDCYTQQMEWALERQKRGEVEVLPILVRPVHSTNAPFVHLPMVPTNGKPVTLWSNEDAAWAHIAEGIHCVLEGKPLPVATRHKHPLLRRSLFIATPIMVFLLILIASNFLSLTTEKSTPEKTLTAFCNALKRGDYRTAYNQTSKRLQSLYEIGGGFEPTAHYWDTNGGHGKTIACVVDGSTTDGSPNLNTITNTYTDRTRQRFYYSLVNEGGLWKIDDSPAWRQLSTATS